MLNWLKEAEVIIIALACILRVFKVPERQTLE
jgi:hypothetical protein